MRNLKLWAGRYRILLAILAVVTAVLCVVPIILLNVSLSNSDTFPGYSSPIFIVPVVMLVIFGLVFLLSLVALLIGRREPVR
jgi:hypothetical protein